MTSRASVEADQLRRRLNKIRGRATRLAAAGDAEAVLAGLDRLVQVFDALERGQRGEGRAASPERRPRATAGGAAS